MTVRILHGDMLAVLPTLDAESCDSVVTDPPAGIGFMNREWDHHKGGRDQWIAWMQQCAAECLRVIKPGGHALVWSLPRTSHWTATAWENAGWEVRDRLAHLFGTGFPKSHNISVAIDKAAGAVREVVGRKVGRQATPTQDIRGGSYAGGNGVNSSIDCSAITAPATPAAAQWDGWGAALKPACEDWWLLRKPLSEASIAANVLRHGVGGLNIEASRVGTDEITQIRTAQRGWREAEGRTDIPVSANNSRTTTVGRYPANLLHDGSDEVLAAFAAFGTSKSTAQPRNNKVDNPVPDSNPLATILGRKRATTTYGHADTGTAARFFYAAKASKADRAGSRHPTIKPMSLMSWLCRLITPPNGTILDPFAGSGTTLQAADALGFNAIGIEQSAEYVADIHRRMQAACPLFMAAE